MECSACNKSKSLIKKGINISKSYVNLIIKDEKIESKANDRLKICLDCSFKGKILSIGNKDIYKCNQCSCPIEALIRSNETCPIGKWK